VKDSDKEEKKDGKDPRSKDQTDKKGHEARKQEQDGEGAPEVKKLKTSSMAKSTQRTRNDKTKP